MRVTGGSLKGMRLACPEGEIRPAMDRMKECVFAVLGDLSGLRFLDLFSGSGSIAIEAVSRGAESALAVEKDARKRPTLDANARKAGGKVKVSTMPAELCLKRLKEAYDIAFFDPPFPYEHRLSLLRLASESQAIADGGLVLMHFPEEERLPEEVDCLILEDTRKFGRSVVNFYRKKRVKDS